MCNEVARRISLGQLREDWSQLRVPLVFPEGLPNLAPLDSIRITDPTLILRAAREGQGAEGVTRRWSWPGPGGKPVYNFRSEGRAFVNCSEAGRCLIPVDAFFEFTDPKPANLGVAPKRARKDKWRFTQADQSGSPQSTTLRGGDAWFCIAGWWRTEPALGDGTAREAFTMLTCEPGPDIAPYHHRQIVLPPRHQWAGWLDGSLAAAEVCRPTPAGTLMVKPAA